MEKAKDIVRDLRHSTPKRLLLSYILDWCIIFLIAGLGSAFNYITPYHRPFSPLDLTLSYPLIHPELVPIPTLLTVCGMVPALLIAFIALVLVPGPAYSKRLNTSQKIRLKLWEFEKGWAGFTLSLAIAFFVTQAMKNCFGKPRPNMLARCMPDLQNIAAHVVGGYGGDVSDRWVLVDSGICTTTQKAVLDDGFRSFPSGHSSFAWSGMLYLSLFLCSKFAIAIPYLPSADQTIPPSSSQPKDMTTLSTNGYHNLATSSAEGTSYPPQAKPEPTPSVRNHAASPPNHLIILAFFPIALAIWICSTRYAQFYHFGFDIISGSLIGILSAWFAFRWYHLPVRRGQGWAWGARSEGSAFGVGVGAGGYAAVGNARVRGDGAWRDV